VSIFDDDDGLPDAAFTEDELAAGVQHLARGHWRDDSSDEHKIIESEYFETYKDAMSWAKNHPGKVITRAPDGQRFMLKKNSKENGLSEKNGILIKDSREFFERISYRRVGHLNVKLMKNVLRQLSLAELKSLKPLLDIELKSCYKAIEMCKFYKKGGRNESLQAGDIEMMFEEVNFILEQ